MYGADLTGTQFGDANGVGQGTDLAQMDGVDMTKAIVATTSGTYTYTFNDYYGNPVAISQPYNATLLGSTTKNTKCPPDGTKGPCSLS